MSTDRKRLSSAIQRIAKSDPDLRGAIEATRNRGDQPGASGVGTSESERDRICCDGSVNDDANPGTSTRDPDSGGQDASSGLNSDNPADIGEMGEGSLTGLTDCSTGEPICFDGSGFVPPDGWGGPSSPPVDPEYIEGSWFDDLNGGAYQTPGPAASSAMESTSSGVNGTIIEYFRGSGLMWRVRYINNNNGLIYNTSFYERLCSASYNSICDEDPPVTDSWPTDGCVNLAVVGGSIVGSKYDPENDGSYSKPMSEIEMCDDFGNSFYLRPSAGGGWKSISDLTTGPDGHLYDSTGMQIRRISHDEFTDSTV